MGSMMLGYIADTVNAPTECTNSKVMGIIDANLNMANLNDDLEPVVIYLYVNVSYLSIDCVTSES